MSTKSRVQITIATGALRPYLISCTIGPVGRWCAYSDKARAFRYLDDAQMAARWHHRMHVLDGDLVECPCGCSQYVAPAEADEMATFLAEIAPHLHENGEMT